LQNSDNYFQELPIIRRADSILGISQNLCTRYFLKYYGYIPKKIHLWPNSVDTTLWNYDRWKAFICEKSRPKIGLAGNINYVIDLELLTYLVENIPECNFELAGKVDLNSIDKLKFQKLLSFPNIKHLGFIPFDNFPQIVINWDIGLVAAKPDHEYAQYLNNNKQYQYMSLGKPFVTYSFNAEYLTFEDLVFIAEDKKDFIDKIKLALSSIKNKDLLQKGVRIAEMNSADNRAIQFLKIASSI
jgi:glycosyltransferase involved in cell wall biosynthesis